MPTSNGTARAVDAPRLPCSRPPHTWVGGGVHVSTLQVEIQLGSYLYSYPTSCCCFCFCYRDANERWPPCGSSQQHGHPCDVPGAHEAVMTEPAWSAVVMGAGAPLLPLLALLPLLCQLRGGGLSAPSARPPKPPSAEETPSFHGARLAEKVYVSPSSPYKVLGPILSALPHQACHLLFPWPQESLA